MSDTHRHADDRLRLTRLARGHSQGDLAKAAGITRQAISGIESGRWSPSLDVALCLARALDSSVEDLFGEAPEAAPVTGRLAVRPSRVSATAPRRLLLSEVAGDTIAFPLSRDVSLVPGFVPAFGVAREVGREHGETGANGTNGSPGSNGSPDGRATDEPESLQTKRNRPRQATVDALRIVDEVPTLALAGCDPALALLQSPLQHHNPPVGLVWWPCGNGMALELLEAGAVHAAAVHRGTDSRARHRPGVEAVGFAAWREGLGVAPRHRGRVKDLRDIVNGGLRIANRERGSEARRLLDDHLVRLGIEASEVAGYDTECTAHLLVASAVGSGLADAGVMTEPSALAFGLEFVPWQQEISELQIPRSLMSGVEVRALLDVLGGRELPRQLAALEGYDADPCGRILAA